VETAHIPAEKYSPAVSAAPPGEHGTPLYGCPAVKCHPRRVTDSPDASPHDDAVRAETVRRLERAMGALGTAAVAQMEQRLVSIPFAATGALGLLLVTGTPLSLPALIGMLMLIGIVVTNAIVLIDLVNQYRAKGMELREAVVEGSRHRLRPVLMTALATIGALTPMALGITGGGAFISQPLAIVVIGGLISSTLLTLILVPVLYTMTEAAKERRLARRKARREAELAAARAAAGQSEPAPAEAKEDATN
jgi:hypothetical protein